MKTSVLGNPAKNLVALTTLGEWSDSVHMAYAWISSANGKANHWRALPLKKVKRAVVGVHFAQSEPYALGKLLSEAEGFRVIEDTSGVFHPKVIIGFKGTEAKVIVGSSNFTKGGFQGNTELNLFLEGPADSPSIVELIQFIDRCWDSARAFRPTEEWLERYETVFKKRPKPPRLPPASSGQHLILKSEAALEVSWPEYYALIVAQERRTLANGHEIHIFEHPEGSYIEEATNCYAAFLRSEKFSGIPVEKRKLVSGWGPKTSGFFGSMSGAGYFKQLVTDDPETLGKHIDSIPLSGPVSKEQAGGYLNEILKVRGVSLGCATRLLTVKRPDLFLTLNGANEKRIRDIFGHAPSTAGSYLKLHDKLWAMPWFLSSEPEAEDERRAWKARVGLLDALLYESTS